LTRLRIFFVCLPLLLTTLLATPLAAHAATWHAATREQLRPIIPARAPVVSERIETEFRTASGITDGEGHFVAGAVLITAGYSADGKYSHYLLAQVPIKIADTELRAGSYLIGWSRNSKGLGVTLFEAATGKPVVQTEATLNESIHRVESFRIWPPGSFSAMQIGRFTFAYSIVGR